MQRHPLFQFIGRLISDSRLKPVHLLLSIALCDRWAAGQFAPCYAITRSSLMRAARIRSTATYHKAIKELQTFGYIKYYPSYHPGKHSRIEILNADGAKEQGLDQQTPQYRWEARLRRTDGQSELAIISEFPLTQWRTNLASTLKPWLSEYLVKHLSPF